MNTGRKRGRPRKNPPETKKPKISDEHLSSFFSPLSGAISLTRSFISSNVPFLDPAQVQALESSVSATASSLSILHPSLSLPHANSLPQHSHSPPRTLTVDAPPPPPDRLFCDDFHISKFSFDSLLQILSPSLKKAPDDAVAPDRKLSAALYRLAKAATFKTVGQRFGLETDVACRTFYQVCKAVNDNFANLLWDIQSEQRRILDGFGKLSLPNCCGVLGFGPFSIDSGMDGDGAMIVQALVDAEGYFLDISAGWPGSLPPEGILYRTKLFSRVESKELLSGPHRVLATGDSVRQYVLGDSCCPLLPWLMTPYREPNPNDSQRIFNFIHRRGMELVNNTFRQVMNRWKLLNVTWRREFVDVFPFIIITGCLLHNFLGNCGEPPMEECDGDCWKEPRFPEHGGVKSENEDGESVRAMLSSHMSLAC